MMIQHSSPERIRVSMHT
ncbi:Protein of unknown function [Pyronema omphalodes CBS 100304]|uniref:Uncharacterized protein n=1 Tax=Pyronema omphalodes (strain CBS 100304) TaxID=1076935 RepID=U4LAL1_PYROM|nr:Protein of unknown function [Pyronema omphalodes CBS 100304]